MRLAALADLHLGSIGGSSKLIEQGFHQRERDVEETITRVFDRVIALAPDLVTVAGDIFHHARPSNRAVIHAMREFGRLTAALPQTIVIAVAGNHDLSKERGRGSALPLLSHVGVHVAAFDATRFDFPERGLSVLGVPDIHGVNRPALTPDSSARYNVLVLHGEVAGVTQGSAQSRTNLTDVTDAELGGAATWSYIALGHYHQFEQLAPNMAYSGAPDFTSFNPWQELATPKGFVLYDLDAQTLTFEVVEPSRRWIDLPRLEASGMGVEQVNAAIADALAAAPIADAVVRLIVEGHATTVSRGIDQQAIAAFRRRTIGLHVDLRPARRDINIIHAAHEAKWFGAPASRRKPLEVEVVDRLRVRTSDPAFPSDVDPKELEDGARHYLALAKEKDDAKGGSIAVESYDGLTDEEARQYAADDEAYRKRMAAERDAQQLMNRLETSLKRSA